MKNNTAQVEQVEQRKESLTEKYYECETCFYEPLLAAVLGHIFVDGLPVSEYKCPKCGNYTVRKVRRKIWDTITLATIYKKIIPKKNKINKCFHQGKRKGVAC